MGIVVEYQKQFLRNAYEIITKEELQNVVFNDVRGHEGVRYFTADLKGTEIKVAIVNGLANARQLLEDIKSGKAHYDLVEVMACQAVVWAVPVSLFLKTVQIYVKNGLKVYTGRPTLTNANHNKTQCSLLCMNNG